ncbi:electron transport complex, RnfABCDGE type, C subunit [Chloroherpeton thalassium ATCC 35110]|uniref:Ion-translocating oxidoreductase complex subunit C n=1 Tax=Chloroherpeton thalassium (strain ATCC 35110 / GB-78) TaxID=517418 RepID=B3QTB1_CHLT3|nr:electron transport complex subunit RsxC [Chloroherpeton thalassium]ACF14210.1 electron transport complex, RnfABCDGE type, C subunit [Chloroherpeton thalassium ATCC 35110]
MKTFKIGGIHPPENKLTEGNSIEVLPIPSELAIPLLQHLGKPAKPVVKAGQRVKKGELIGEADGFISANVHATTSGTIKAIKSHPHPGGQYAPTVFLESDGQDEWLDGCNTEPQDWQSFSKEDILNRIKAAGVVGMGGAGFPTNVKLAPPKDKVIDTVILNGAECEPFLTSDHRLMVEEPEGIIEGLKIITSLFSTPVKAYVGVEANKKDAIEALAKYASSYNFEVVQLETKYPQGAEKQLINSITGRKIQEGELPFDKGCIVNNVGTAFAVYEAVCKNKPLIERVVTVSGIEIQAKKNLKVIIGTMFSDIISACGNIPGTVNQVISGGPMMGKAQYSFEASIIKTSSGILFINNEGLDTSRERTCIRCGKCVEACPQELQPWLFTNLAQRREFDELPAYGLFNCTECGSCTYVCPSKREIVHWIKYSKAIVNNRKKRKSA